MRNSAERGSQCSHPIPGMPATSPACLSHRNLSTTWTAALLPTTVRPCGVRRVKLQSMEFEMPQTARYRPRPKYGLERTRQERDSRIHVIVGTTITCSSVASVWLTMRRLGSVAATLSVTRSYASTVSEITNRLHRHQQRRTRRP